MARLVRDGRTSWVVRDAAQRIALSSPHLHPVDAVFRYVRSMPYVRDADIAARRGWPTDSEVVHGAPYQILARESLGDWAAPGDCDDRAVLLQSLCEALGYRTRFALIRGPGRDDYSHVYSEVLVDGRWIPADPIMNGNQGRPLFALGDEVPERRDKLTVNA
jgi:transglutaminase-like putative cysteine protease